MNRIRTLSFTAGSSLTLLLLVACSSGSSDSKSQPESNKQETNKPVEGNTVPAAKNHPTPDKSAPAIKKMPVADFMSDFDQAKEPLDLSGCPYVSEDHQQFACWNVELEMGFGALSLDFYSRATPGKYDRVDIFGRGDNDDDWTKRAQNITDTKKRFQKSHFSQVSWTKPADSKRYPASSPIEAAGLGKFEVSELDKERPNCCKWMVSTQQSSEITGLQLVHAFGDCDYVDKRGDTCHVDDYNEESYSSEEAYFLVPKADGTTAVQYNSYLKALTAGRNLSESDAEGAISAFEQAIVLNPNSATAYSELSWIRLSSKDYEAAKSDALKSIELGKALPVIQAMSYYNLGRALEAQKNTDDAIAAYMSSYTLRQHKVVAKRITELGKELPKSVWKAKALAGPFADLAAYCAPMKLSGTDRDGSGDYCETKVRPFEKVSVSLPWASQLGSIDVYDSANQDLPASLMVFKTDKGWFVFPDFEHHANRYDWMVNSASTSNSRLVLRHQNTEGRFETQLNKYITVCGIGSASSVSCFGPTQVFDSYTGYEGSKELGHSTPEEVALDCQAEFEAKDMLVIDGKGRKCQSLPGFVGSHELTFP